MNNDLLRMEDLVNNPTARVPVCLCLDVSGSMNGEPIHELNEGVRMFYNAIQEDETALSPLAAMEPTVLLTFPIWNASQMPLYWMPVAGHPWGRLSIWDLICLRSERMSIRARGWIITNPGSS